MILVGSVIESSVAEKAQLLQELIDQYKPLEIEVEKKYRAKCNVYCKQVKKHPNTNQFYECGTYHICMYKMMKHIKLLESENRILNNQVNSLTKQVKHLIGGK